MNPTIIDEINRDADLNINRDSADTFYMVIPPSDDKKYKIGTNTKSLDSDFPLVQPHDIFKILTKDCVVCTCTVSHDEKIKVIKGKYYAEKIDIIEKNCATKFLLMASADNITSQQIIIHIKEYLSDLEFWAKKSSNHHDTVNLNVNIIILKMFCRLRDLFMMEFGKTQTQTKKNFSHAGIDDRYDYNMFEFELSQYICKNGQQLKECYSMIENVILTLGYNMENNNFMDIFIDNIDIFDAFICKNIGIPQHNKLHYVIILYILSYLCDDIINHVPITNINSRDPMWLYTLICDHPDFIEKCLLKLNIDPSEMLQLLHEIVNKLGSEIGAEIVSNIPHFNKK